MNILHMKFRHVIPNIYMEGTLSQNFDMFPSFVSCNVENLILKKIQKIPVF